MIQGLWVLGGLWSAHAQDSSDSPEEDEASFELIVTGTRATNRTSLDASAPVDVFDVAELRASGAVGNEVGQALAVVAPSFFFPRQSNSGTSDHVRAGQLRGLSPDQVLVLVNGRRRHTSAVVNSETKIGRGTAAVDFNTIPLGAIKRIEVLRDGAGAQYGSDAIAGVINLILDDDPESSLVTLTAGAHATFEGAIDQTLVDGETTTLEAETGFRVGEDGFVRLGIEGLLRQETNRAGFDQVPFFYLDDKLATDDPNLSAQGRRNYFEGDPRTRGLSGWFNSEIDLGRSTLYAFGTLAGRRTLGATFFRYPRDSRNVPEVYPNGFLPLSRGNNLDGSISVGVRTPISGWDLDVGATWGHNTFSYGVINSINASLGAQSPTEFDSGSYTLNQINLDATLQRNVPVNAFYDAVSVALGVGSRQERFGSAQGQPASFRAGPEDAAIGAQGAVGLSPDDVRNVNRGVYFAFADLSSRIAKPWFLDVAGRYELYSDVGSTLTGKAATVLQPLDQLRIRGSISNSFRAPAVAQIGFADRSINFGEDRALILTRTTPVDDPVAQALGAQDLGPERALDISAGLTVGPFEGLSLTVDAFRIVVNDRITLSERIFGKGLVDAIGGLPGGANVESVRFFTNAVDTQTLGIEGVVGWRRLLGDGELQADLGVSFFDTTIQAIDQAPQQLRDIQDDFELVGVEERNTIETAAPNNKQVLTVSYDAPKLGGTVRASRFGAATRVFNFGGGFEPEQTYGDEFQVDAEFRITSGENLQFAVGGTNLFDEYPDLSSADINFFGNLPYDVLSPIGVNGRYLYLRTTVTL
ncbi:MAG: TonB-dependent receptor [Myxococcota bacterium]